MSSVWCFQNVRPLSRIPGFTGRFCGLCVGLTVLPPGRGAAAENESDVASEEGERVNSGKR